MAFIGTVPRRCVNLPPGSLRVLLGSVLNGKVQEGPALETFHENFAQWLDVSFVHGVSTGRAAFRLALEAMQLKKGTEIIFPMLTFPVMPLIAKMLGYRPVFCDVDPETFNSGPEHIEPKMTENTSAVLATHLFGQPCPIREVVTLARRHQIRVLEDCAHACGVRVDGRQVGTFGDIGIFSFAEGKNMPCFGGGAISTADEAISRRAGEILSKAPMPDKNTMAKKAMGIWVKWLLTRPFIFGITAYQALRLKLLLGQPLMDSTVGDELLDDFIERDTGIHRMCNLQAAVGLLQCLFGARLGAARAARFR